MKKFWSTHKAEIGWLTGLAVIVLLGFYWIPGDRNTADDTFSVATNGKKAVYRATAQLMSGRHRVARSVDQLIPPDDADTLVMLGPARYPDGNEWRALHDWISRGHCLVFAARFDDPAVRPIPRMGFNIEPYMFDLMKRKKKKKKPVAGTVPTTTTTEAEEDAEQDSDEDDESASEATTQQAEVDPTIPVQNVPTTDDDDDEFDDERIASGELITRAVSWRSKGYIVASGSNVTQLLATDGKPCAIVRQIGAGKLVVASSDYIFSNRALLETQRNQQIVWKLLNAGDIDGPVYFDETMNESGTPRTVGLLFNARIRPFTLQLLLATLLFGWWGSRRFGPVQQTDDATRRDVREHAVALGQLHYNVNGGTQALKHTYDRFKVDMRLTTTNPTAHGAVLAARSGMDENEVSDLLNRVSFAMNFHGRLPNAEAAGLIKSLAEVRQRIQKRTDQSAK